MNGIERITARISEDAQAEIDAILSAAKGEAEAIEAEYRGRAEALRAQLRSEAEKSAAEREERLVSAARMEGRKRVLAARWELVEKAYLLAGERLQGQVDALETALRLEKSRGAAETAKQLFG